MRFILMLPLLYAAAVAETSLADLFQVGCVAPDFLALTAMLWLLAIARPGTFLAAGAIGLLEDLISPGCAGLGLAGFLVVGYLVARLRARFGLEHFLWHAAVTWAAVTVLAVGMAVARWLAGEVSLPLLTLMERAAGVGLYTGAVSVPVFMIAAWIREPFLARQRKLAEA